MRTVSRIVPCLAALLGFAFAVAAPVSDRGAMHDLYADAYVHVDGARLVTNRGDVVALHGINLGGWLVTENWMCGLTDVQDQSGNQPGRSTEESLEARFGTAAAAELMETWRDHWITEQDLDHIRDSGFNMVRVPFSYRTLQNADGSWKLDAEGGIDFSRMDWIVRELAAREIYTIFDLHVWPEQRADYEKIGRDDGRAIREAMARLWTAVAEHYRGNGAVLAFDVLNEYPGAWGVQEDLVQAVRRGDPERVVAVEGFTYPEFRALRDAGRFPNSLYSLHVYDRDPVTTEAFAGRLEPLRNADFPVYVGEFLADDFLAATRLMDEAGMHWSSWTYKTADMGDWGIFNYYAWVRTDIGADSFETIRSKWNDDLTSGQQPGASPNYYVNDDRRYTVPDQYAREEYAAAEAVAQNVR